EHHHVGPLLPRQPQRLDAFFRTQRLEALGAEELEVHLARVGVILDDQDLQRAGIGEHVQLDATRCTDRGNGGSATGSPSVHRQMTGWLASQAPANCCRAWSTSAAMAMRS